PFFSLWFDRIVPLLGKALPGGAAYTYLPLSVKRFPDAEGLVDLMRETGFGDVEFRLLGGSIVALHTGGAVGGDLPRSRRSPALSPSPCGLVGLRSRRREGGGRLPLRVRVLGAHRHRRRAGGGDARRRCALPVSRRGDAEAADARSRHADRRLPRAVPPQDRQ